MNIDYFHLMHITKKNKILHGLKSCYFTHIIIKIKLKKEGNLKNERNKSKK